MVLRITSSLAAGAIGVALLAPPASASQAAVAGAQSSGTAAAVAVRATLVAPAKASSTVLRVATFNVRTARAHGDRRTWLQRAGDVARTIVRAHPAVVALQELGPGRADGKKTKIGGAARQTTSLTAALRRVGGARYRLVRTTSYVAPGRAHGTQGSRILYDTSRVTLLSRCPETTGKKNYNPACAFDLPVASGDSAAKRRSAAYARFRDRRTGQQFFVASAHLDERHSGGSDARFTALRVRQANTVARTLARVNPSGLPVVFGGDINSWQSDHGHYAPERAFRAQGYVDTASAPVRVNRAYPTVNHWQRVLKRSGNPLGGPHLDVIMVRHGHGARRWENVMKVSDSARPSDHNMVLAEIVL